MYVANFSQFEPLPATVSVIDTATMSVVGNEIPIGVTPTNGMIVSSDSRRLYVLEGGLARPASPSSTIFNAEPTKAYGHTWTNTCTFTEQYTVTVPPGYEFKILAEQPLWRAYGTFTIVAGNTTLNLIIVYVHTLHTAPTPPASTRCG